MKQDRRRFIRIGGLGLAATGIVPLFLDSCKTGTSDQASDSSGNRGTGGSSVAGPYSDQETGAMLEISGLEDMTRDVTPLTDKDYLGRQQKARRLMEASGIDALWIEGGRNMEYFFDMNWWMSERVFGVVLPVNGDPVWICPGFEAPRAGELIRFGKDIRTWEEEESPYGLLDDLFKTLGTEKVAVGPNVRSFVRSGIARASRTELLDGSDLVNRCRGIKSRKELAFMDLANRITKQAYKWAFEQVQSGMMPSDLRNLISAAHRKQGASGGASPLFGESSAYPHGTRNLSELKEGDIILCDGGCSVEGYRSDVTRTIVFGTPGDKQKKVFDIVHRAQAAAHAAVRPGLQAGELDRIARKVIEDAGYGPDYKYFVHRLGHGIGMDGHEWPYLVKDNPLPLEPGMTFSNEPGIYIYGEFGVRIEDCFVVTEDGGRFLGGMTCNSIEEPFGT